MNIEKRRDVDDDSLNSGQPYYQQQPYDTQTYAAQPYQHGPVYGQAYGQPCPGNIGYNSQQSGGYVQAPSPAPTNDTFVNTDTCESTSSCISPNTANAAIGVACWTSRAPNKTPMHTPGHNGHVGDQMGYNSGSGQHKGGCCVIF